METVAAETTIPRARSSALLALFRLLVLLAGTALYVPLMLAHRALTRDPQAKRHVSALWTSRWSAFLCRVGGIRFTVSGPQPPPGSLLAPNHQGYMDIVALAAVVPTFFVSKIEVVSWPLIGTLFTLSDHVAVNRENVRCLPDVANAVADRLAHGHRVVVFLEATSSSGEGILPFRTPMLEAALRTGAPVVPIAMRWSSTRADVHPQEDIAYWRKDHHFAFHAWRLMGLRGTCVEITFGEPIPSSGHTRQTLAEVARRQLCALYQVPAVSQEQ